MAPGVPRGEDAAGGTWRSVRDSGALKSQGQGGKEDPEQEPDPELEPPEPSLREEESRSGPVRPAPCIQNQPRAPLLGSPCGRQAPPG